MMMMMSDRNKKRNHVCYAMLSRFLPCRFEWSLNNAKAKEGERQINKLGISDHALNVNGMFSHRWLSNIERKKKSRNGNPSNYRFSDGRAAKIVEHFSMKDYFLLLNQES